MIRFLRVRISRLIGRVRGVAERLMERPVPAFIMRIVRELGRDNAGDMAASIAYHSILSVFPLLLGLIALLGLFLPSETVQAEIFSFFDRYLPGSSQVIERNIESVIALRGALGIISILGLFYTASAIFGTLGRVINRAWNITKYRPIYFRKPRDIMIALGMSLLLLLSMALTTFSSVIPMANVPALNVLASIAGRLFAFILLLGMVLLLYKYMPNTKTRWRDIWPGALFAAVIFEIARIGFSIYLSEFASYQLVYGSLAAIIIILVWVYFSAFILIVGAEFASEYTRLRQEREAK